MFEVVFWGITSLIVLSTVSFVINKIKTRQVKYQKSTEQFEVRLDSIAGVVFIIASLFFGFCAYGASTASVENGYYTWIGFAVVAFVCAICVFISLKNIKVKGNDIVYRQYLFPKKINCTFSDITNYSIYGDTITLYNGKKKLFSIDKDMVGCSNLIRRLDKENIICSNDGINIKTIKKSDILLNGPAIALIGLFAFFGFIVFIVEASKSIGTGAGASGIIDGIIFIIIMIGLGLLVAAFICIPPYLKILKIEKGMGISFDNEMAKLGVTKFDYKGEKWYIKDGFIVNRDYIKNIEKVTKHSGNGDNTSASYTYHLRTIDGKIMKFSDTKKNTFSDWFNKN